LILVLVGSFYLARDSAFVQDNRILERIASISLADGQTRFTIWNMAFKGVMERPITGYGQEGFNYVFNKHYNPSLYAQEQWFDRAHNAFIDWLSAGGIPAFLLYISLFGTAIVLLWRRSELSRAERIALTGAIVGYAIHNSFVFDNLYSYIYFFAIIAFIDSQVSRPIALFENTKVLPDEEGTTYVLPIAIISLIVIVWFVNVPGIYKKQFIKLAHLFGKHKSFLETALPTIMSCLCPKNEWLWLPVNSTYVAGKDDFKAEILFNHPIKLSYFINQIFIASLFATKLDQRNNNAQD